MFFVLFYAWSFATFVLAFAAYSVCGAYLGGEGEKHRAENAQRERRTFPCPGRSPFSSNQHLRAFSENIHPSACRLTMQQSCQQQQQPPPSTSAPPLLPQSEFGTLTLEHTLEDLCARFIVNLPAEELASMDRVCFQIEQA